MNTIIYINEEYQELFAKIGCGIVKQIEIYRKDSGKLYFTADRKSVV